MPKFIEGKIECPFYLAEGNAFITCEGVLKNTNCVHKFKSNERKADYEETVCCVQGGRKCNHYRTLSILYERGIKA